MSAAPSRFSHKRGCRCVTCAVLGAKVAPTAAWYLEHHPHLRPGATFERESAGHPDGTWFWLTCSCGAKHLSVFKEA